MTRDEMLMRIGLYNGIASRELGDTQYEDRWRFHAHERTYEDYLKDSAEIQARLVAAGKLSPDEDPFDKYGVDIVALLHAFGVDVNI